MIGDDMTASLRSSSLRETRSESQREMKIGCMSGIFHLINKHNHSRKRLTSERKNDKNARAKMKSLPKIKLPEEIPDEATTPKKIGSPAKSATASYLQRFSCDVPRSPTLTQEIRRSSSVNLPENFRRNPSLVGRLMGLEEIPEESAADKRRKLLGALERCDEDLKALKKVIEAVPLPRDRRRSVESHLKPPRCLTDDGRDLRRGSVREHRIKGRAISEATECLPREFDGGGTLMVGRKGSDFNGDQPSPVSVLDGVHSPLNYRSSTPDKGNQCKKSKEDDFYSSFFHKHMVEALPQFHCPRGNDPFGYFILTARKTRCRKSSFTGSRTMIETVNEVCKDVIWEEKWEQGRIGVVLEGNIFGELVEETVRELGILYKCALPFEACRKRLRF